MKRAFVTGTSGFLGLNFTVFAIKRGWTIHGLYRTDEAKRKIEQSLTDEGISQELLQQQMHYFKGDLGDVEAMRKGMQGATYVFHLAALARDWGPYEEFVRANIVGTENVLQAAKSIATVKRLIHVSTEATCLKEEWGCLTQLDETKSTEYPPPPDWAPYSKSKAQAEKRVLEANGKPKLGDNSENGEVLETVIVRPRLIWGKGDLVVLPILVDAIQKGVFKWFSPSPKTCTCHVRNVCEGMILAAEKGKPGEVYFLTDGPAVDLREFQTKYISASRPDVQLPTSTIPISLVWAAAVFLENLPFLGYGSNKPNPLASRQALALIGQDVTIDDSKARRELGYTSHVSVQEGLYELTELQNKNTDSK